MLFFLLLASVVAFDANEGQIMSGSDLFIFFQGALILFAFRGTALGTPLGAVGRDLYNGTLEFLYTNPCSRYAYYVGTVLSSVIINLPVFLPLYLVLVFYSGAHVENMLMILSVCVIVFVSLTAMGVMIAMLGLLWRRIDSIAGLINIAFEFLAGAYFPVSSFPQVVQYAAYILPFTWGFDLIRYYSFGKDWNTILPVWQEWTILAMSAVIFTALSRYLLKKVERLAKQKGLHLI